MATATSVASAIAQKKASASMRLVASKFDSKTKADIMASNSDFICYGNLIKMSRFNFKQDYTFFLFSDYLYYASRRKSSIDDDKRSKGGAGGGDKQAFVASTDLSISSLANFTDDYLAIGASTEYDLHQKLSLSSIIINIDKSKKGGNLEFMISHPIKSFVVVADTQENKNRWISTLDAIIERLRLRTDGESDDDDVLMRESAISIDTHQHDTRTSLSSNNGNISVHKISSVSRDSTILNDGKNAVSDDTSGINAGGSNSAAILTVFAANSIRNSIASSFSVPSRLEGDFRKQGHINIFSWKERHFILENGSISYVDKVSNKKMGEIADLSDFDVEIVSRDQLTILSATGKKGLTLSLIAPKSTETRDENKLKTWELAIREHIAYCNRLANRKSL